MFNSKKTKGKTDTPVKDKEDVSIVERLEQLLPTLDSPEIGKIVEQAKQEGRDFKEELQDAFADVDAKDLKHALANTAKVLGIAATAAIVWGFFHRSNKTNKEG